MTLLIHYSDFAEFSAALALSVRVVTRERLYATTRWVRGMPETTVTVEAAFATYDELHRFSQHMGTIIMPGEHAERIRAAVDELHARIEALARQHSLHLHPGRVQLWSETMGKGGSL